MERLPTLCRAARMSGVLARSLEQGFLGNIFESLHDFVQRGEESAVESVLDVLKAVLLNERPSDYWRVAACSPRWSWRLRLFPSPTRPQPIAALEESRTATPKRRMAWADELVAGPSSGHPSRGPE